MSGTKIWLVFFTMHMMIQTLVATDSRVTFDAWTLNVWTWGWGMGIVYAWNKTFNAKLKGSCLEIKAVFQIRVSARTYAAMQIRRILAHAVVLKNYYRVMSCYTGMPFSYIHIQLVTTKLAHWRDVLTLRPFYRLHNFHWSHLSKRYSWTIVHNLLNVLSMYLVPMCVSVTAVFVLDSACTYRLLFIT